MFLAILITGGAARGGYLKSAEIYRPSDNTSCSLPELPEGRAHHTQDGPWACGGIVLEEDRTERTCDKWSEGSWTPRSLSLREKKEGHVSWASASGLYLMGGEYNRKTSELVMVNGTVEKGFPLKYDVR